MPPILKVSNFTATFLGFKGVKSAVTYTILIFDYIHKQMFEWEWINGENLSQFH